jgi:hypothetical protein
MPHHHKSHGRDRVIADTGWGIKPDDQPSNVNEAPTDARRVYRYDPSESDIIRRILLAQRRSCNTANRVRVEPGRVAILDINGDAFFVEGLRVGDPNLIPLLQTLGAAFDPDALRNLPAGGDGAPREYPLSRAWAWGAERAGG